MERSKVEFISKKNFEKISLNSIQKGNLEFLINVTTDAKLLSPVDEGELRNSYQYLNGTGETGGLNNEAGDAGTPLEITLKDNEGVIGNTADYAVYQEFGTSRMRPQPSLRPAVALNTGQNFSDVKRAIAKEMARGVLKAGQKRETFIK